MILIGAAVLGLGLACILVRRTLLGVLIGLQICATGSALLFAYIGAVSGAAVRGQVFALLIVLSSVALLVTGYALASRLFFLNKRADMVDVRNLKN